MNTSSKLNKALAPELIERLSAEEKELFQYIEERFRWSLQNLRQGVSWILDTHMWREKGFRDLWQSRVHEAELKGEKGNYPQAGKWLFEILREDYENLLKTPKKYSLEGVKEFRPKYKYADHEISGRLVKLCPAASEKAVCCNLQTMDVVENCAMGCSYCVLQTHYGEDVIKVPTNLKEKLAQTHIPPGKRYRIGTGEYSDSLMWGNTNNILTDLLEWADGKDNVILELKTKSANVKYLLENPVPRNVVCSWSLNPEIIIKNEEHGTASLERRLQTARKIADKGLKVGFHIHPMMYFEGWEKEYQELIGKVLHLFKPEEVLWVSLGCVTMLKGFADELRKNFRNSKLLQMPTEVTPDHKITYSYDIRKKLYTNAYEALAEWEGKVFQYMCMEHEPMWLDMKGFAYQNMAEFNDAFSDSIFPKLPAEKYL